LGEVCEYIVNTWNDTNKLEEKNSHHGLKKVEYFEK